MGSSNHTIEVNKEEGFKNDISMLSDSLLVVQSSSSKSTITAADNNNNSNVNVAALQIQSSSSNSSQKLSVSSKDNSINGHNSTSNHSTTNSITNYSNNMDRPPRVRTSSNGSSNPGSANNSPKQRSPKPPLQCVTDSNGGTGQQQFPSSPLGKCCVLDCFVCIKLGLNSSV